MLTPQDVIAAIQRGDFDGVLTPFSEELRLRKEHLVRSKAVNFRAGAGKYRGSRIRVPLALIDAPSHAVANNLP